MRGIQREELKDRFAQQIKAGIPLNGSGAGTGITAKALANAQVDLIIIYNSGRFRMGGRGSTGGSLPFSDANAMLFEMAKEVLPAANGVPVIAGVYAHDPLRRMEDVLQQVIDAGFSGVQNFPTAKQPVDALDFFNLEETGFGYDKEVEMIRLAHNMGLYTTPYCFTVEQAEAMARAGADLIVAHMGLTTSSGVGAKTGNALDSCVEKTAAIARAAKAINPDVLVICHGGFIAGPEDTQYIYDRVPDIVGFYGASSAERIPVEKELSSTIAAFKQVRISERADKMPAHKEETDTRKRIIGRLNKTKNQGTAIVATGAGIGLTAKIQAKSGVDLVVVDSAARWRMAGVGTFASIKPLYHDYDWMISETREIMPVVKDSGVPIIAGIAANPPFYDREEFIERMLNMGYSGICNSPTTGWQGWRSRTTNTRAMGLGYDCDVDMVQYCAKRNIFTIAQVFDEEQAHQMSEAGADVICLNIGLTTGGYCGAKTYLQEDEAEALLEKMATAALGSRAADTDKPILLCQGGFLNSPDAVAKVLADVPLLSGFFGGSATDRLPMERAIYETAKDFKKAKLHRS